MLEMFGRPELVTVLLSGMQDGFVVLDKDNVHVFVNDAFCRLTGFTREELVGSGPPFLYWPPEELANITAAFQRTIANERTSFELVFSAKDGRRIPVIVSPSSIGGPDGAVIGHVATVKDITERKRLEHALSESEQRWRSVAENPFDYVVIIDRQYRYVYVNHVAPGLTREALIGEATPFDLSAPEHHEAMRAAFEATFETGHGTSFDAYSPQLGVWYNTIVGPIWEDGKVIALSLLTRDITRQKQAEDQLRESHKLETIGTLAGGIAHDLNNILTPILAYSDLAQLSVHPDHAVQKELRAIHDGALRARDLVRRILLFSRHQEPHKEILDLGAQVREGVKLLASTIPASIDFVLDLPEQPVWVLGDRGRFDQVLVNLVANALQAMAGMGGRITVAVRPGPAALLTVTDSGPGMDAETQRRAFDPFFTTRPGVGTGLGLAIVQRIVRDHGGRVSVFSGSGGGAAFTVELPAAVAPEASSPPEVVTAATRGAGLRVLCVDDEPEVLRVTRLALERSGYVVRSLSSPVEALRVLSADPASFDVLVTDQTMPGMTGTALVRAARALRPDLACVVVTGFADEATVDSVRALGLVELLCKPYSAASLASVVAQAALARSRPAS